MEILKAIDEWRKEREKGDRKMKRKEKKKGDERSKDFRNDK